MYVPTIVYIFGVCIQANQFNETKQMTTFKTFMGQRLWRSEHKHRRYFVRRLAVQTKRHVTPPQSTDVTAGVWSQLITGSCPPWYCTCLDSKIHPFNDLSPPKVQFISRHHLWIFNVMFLEDRVRGYSLLTHWLPTTVMETWRPEACDMTRRRSSHSIPG
jgi:hypothetical protein